jgi:uncharacterized protein (DUF58 family)
MRYPNILLVVGIFVPTIAIIFALALSTTHVEKVMILGSAAIFTGLCFGYRWIELQAEDVRTERFLTDFNLNGVSVGELETKLLKILLDKRTPISDKKVAIRLLQSIRYSKIK